MPGLADRPVLFLARKEMIYLTGPLLFALSALHIDAEELRCTRSGRAANEALPKSTHIFEASNYFSNKSYFEQTNHIFKAKN